MSMNRVQNKLESRTTLLGAGGDDRPNPLAPAAAGLAPRSLRNPPVDYHEADRLFRQVVGRLDARRGDEAEVRLSMLMKAFGQILGWPSGWHTSGCRLHHLLPCRLQRLLESGDRHLLAAMNDSEQFPQRRPHPLPVGLLLSTRQRHEKLHVADQVGQAELHQHIELPHVFAVGTEVIAVYSCSSPIRVNW